LVELTFELKGSEEVPPKTSKGTGTANLTYDSATKLLKWKVTYSGLTGPATAGHIHGLADPGKNAPVVMTPAECGNSQCFGGQRNVLENYYNRGERCLDADNGKFPTPPPQGAALRAFDYVPKFSAPNAVNQVWELVNTKDWGPTGRLPGDP
jgi:hypothetical protein